MMPEQQSLVLYIVVSKVRLDGSLAKGKKMAPGLQKRLGEPPQHIPVVCGFSRLFF